MERRDKREGGRELKAWRINLWRGKMRKQEYGEER